MVFSHKALDNDSEISAEITEFVPSHFMVIIESCSLLSDKFECQEFEAGGYKWRLVIYPNGKDVSVYLSVVEPNSLDMSWEVNVMFGIFLNNQMANNFLCKRIKSRCKFDALSSVWGLSKFISKKALMDPSNGYVMNDTCVFGAEVFVFGRPGTIERLSLTKIAEPYVRSWTISEYSRIEDKWESENFTVADQVWYVSLIPRGSGEAKGRHVAIFLYLVNENNQLRFKVEAGFTARIKDQIRNKHRVWTTSPKWFGAAHWGWVFEEFVPIADINDPNKGFLVKDCCILEIELTVLAVARCSP